MKTGGKGGANTVTGLHFEKKADFLAVLGQVKGYSIAKDGTISFNGTPLAMHLRKSALYKFLKAKGINHEEIISKKLLPDDAVYVFATNTLHIIEMKFQKVSGSVDEKLQTSAFKRAQYMKLVRDLGAKVEYYYILNDWFSHPSYKDVLAYIRENGCDYFFNTIPLNKLGLPEAN
ncbi:MAG: hypothetical protein HZA81_02450 [Candidatus Taylorbacteria bacterium]|nr:hypothetical protein [Candidatus Taylorbacteria bacterium]